MKKPHFFIGLDISVDTFAAAVSSNCNETVDYLGEDFKYDTEGFASLIDLLADRGSNKNNSVYIGICPHEFSSGTSVYRKPKSTGYGSARLRKLLYLASMSVRTHNRNFHNYFERKVAEGKNKHLILNNIANKLLRIVCAIIKNGTDYSDNYMSVHPKFLK